MHSRQKPLWHVTPTGHRAVHAMLRSIRRSVDRADAAVLASVAWQEAVAVAEQAATASEAAAEGAGVAAAAAASASAANVSCSALTAGNAAVVAATASAVSASAERATVVFARSANSAVDVAIATEKVHSFSQEY